MYLGEERRERERMIRMYYESYAYQCYRHEPFIRQQGEFSELGERDRVAGFENFLYM